MALLVVLATGLCVRAYHGFRVLSEEARLLENIEVGQWPTADRATVFPARLTEGNVELTTTTLMKPSFDNWNSLVPRRSVQRLGDVVAVSGIPLATLPSVLDMQEMEHYLQRTVNTLDGALRVTRKSIDVDATLFCCGKLGANGELQTAPADCPFYLMAKHPREVARDLRNKSNQNRAEALLWFGVAAVSAVLSIYSSGE